MFHHLSIYRVVDDADGTIVSKFWVKFSIRNKP